MSQVIHEVAGQPGFDIDYCYRLLTLCQRHQDKFPPNAAGKSVVKSKVTTKLHPCVCAGNLSYNSRLIRLAKTFRSCFVKILKLCYARRM